MARWNEREHPRDGEGQFTEKGTGWVGKVSDKIASQRGLGQPWKDTTMSVTTLREIAMANRLDPDSPKIRALAEDIRRNGIKERLQVEDSPKGMFLGDGTHRLLAAERAGLKELPVRIYDATPEGRRAANRAMADREGLRVEPEVVGRGGMRPATERDLLRVKQLTGKKIPPAWTDVRVADDLDNARLLVQGKDAKGRLQSVYSAAHTQAQAAAKFKRVTELMKHLDKLDASIDRDAVDNDHAAALMLIRRLGMRPGSDRNTGADKAAHGATNLRARHVKVSGSKVSFDFTGKKGVHIQLEVDDPDIAAVVSSRLRRKSGDDRLFDTNETRTRDYMKTTGVPPEFLLKDLRTVRANVVALRQIAQMDPPANKAQFQRQRRRVAEAVSAQLGNTPTLALASYINPTVFSPWVRQEDWL